MSQAPTDTKRRQAPPTLRFMAKLLQVHVSTVSRVLNGTEEDAKSAAAPETVARIRELARELNYRPNPYAIGLRTQKTRTVAVLIPRVTDVVVSTIYEGVDAAAAKHGYLTFLSQTGDSPQRQREAGQSALDRRVEGLIVADARLDEPGFLHELEARDVPLVLVSRRLDNLCSVTCDDIAGGRIAAKHLLSLGHREIAVLAGEPYASSGADRLAGFSACCREHGITVPNEWIIHGPFHAVAGRAAGNRILSRKRRPTAIFAVNDFLAIGLMGAMRDHGVRPGDDIAVVGFNDIPIAGDLPIGLSSVRSPMHQIGYRSMQVLLERIGGGRPECVRLTPELVIRASSDPSIKSA